MQQPLISEEIENEFKKMSFAQAINFTIKK